MNIDFEKWLFIFTVLTGLICAINRCFLAAQRKPGDSLPWFVDYSKSFFPILLTVFVLRSFFFEPFRIPSPSLAPTLLPGDFILVNKFIYGIRLPILHKKVVSFGNPKRGDIVVFRWPPNPTIDYIKRVVGEPGDVLAYQQKTLSINGHVAAQKPFANLMQADQEGRLWAVDELIENLAGISHHIYRRPQLIARDFSAIKVPTDHYFMMGDNRDDSADSRFWGFVPDNHVLGKAVRIWFSWDQAHWRVRWDRIGKKIT